MQPPHAGAADRQPPDGQGADGQGADRQGAQHQRPDRPGPQGARAGGDGAGPGRADGEGRGEGELGTGHAGENDRGMGGAKTPSDCWQRLGCRDLTKLSIQFFRGFDVSVGRLFRFTGRNDRPRFLQVLIFSDEGGGNG